MSFANIPGHFSENSFVFFGKFGNNLKRNFKTRLRILKLNVKGITNLIFEKKKSYDILKKILKEITQDISKKNLLASKIIFKEFSVKSTGNVPKVFLEDVFENFQGQ